VWTLGHLVPGERGLGPRAFARGGTVRGNALPRSWSNWGPKSAVPRSSKIRCGDLLCNSAGILGRGDRIWRC